MVVRATPKGYKVVTRYDRTTRRCWWLCGVLTMWCDSLLVSNDRQRPGEQGSCDEVWAVSHGVLA